jgi:hypothetical protein
VQAIRQAVDGLARGGLQVAVTGSAALVADGGVSSKTLNILLLTALLIVVIILILVYRSPLLWLLPLLGAFGAIVVAEAAMHGMLNAGLTVSTLSAAILRVLVLGAATDYALLLIHRYREELRQHADTGDAMAAALRRTLPTLLASAGTVVCAMVCLLAAQSASLHGLGRSARCRSSRPCSPRSPSCPRCCWCWGGRRSGRGSPATASPGVSPPGCGRASETGSPATPRESPSPRWCCSAPQPPAWPRCTSTTARWPTSRAIPPASPAQTCSPSTTGRE